MSFTHSIEIQNGRMAIAKVLTEDGELLTAVAGQPNFELICTALLGEPDESVVNLFDVARAVEAEFRRVSPRVTVKDRTVYYDGDVLNSGVSKQILRLVEEGDLSRLNAVANFTEKVMTNPQEHSRDQLFTWLERHNFTITDDGLIVAYKGCNGTPSAPLSSRRAPAADGVFRNDEPVVDEFVLNLPGDVITMPRSNVDFNAYVGCSTGLHVGTFAYARSFAANLLEVHVDPRDVVSVPTDCDAQKVRVCRYTVIGPIDAEYAVAVLPKAQVDEPVTEVDDEFAEDAEWVTEREQEPVAEPQVGDLVTLKVERSRMGSEAGVGVQGKIIETPDIWNQYYTVSHGQKYGGGNFYAREDFDLLNEVKDVTKAEKWDTRNNYTKQKRYPKGHPKAGQFIPKN